MVIFQKTGLELQPKKRGGGVDLYLGSMQNYLSSMYYAIKCIIMKDAAYLHPRSMGGCRMSYIGLWLRSAFILLDKIS